MTAAPTSRRWWSNAWRIAVATVLGALFFIVLSGTALESVPHDSPDAARIALRLLLDLAVGVVIIVLYGFRHRLPNVVPYVAIPLTAFSLFGAAAAAALVVSVAARRRPLPIALSSLLFLAVTLVDVTPYPFPHETTWWELLLTSIVSTGSLVLIGLLVGSRRQLHQAREDQFAAAEAAQEAQVERARAQERARIAREMHDVLGHRLSLLSVHAGALEYRRDLSAEQTAETAGVIRENSHLALNELRQVLGVLRDESEHALSTPQPSAHDIPDLIDEARAAGATIVVEALELDDIDPAAGRHLFRIVQELLTNARKHAPGHPLTLNLVQANGSVRLYARNALGAAPSAPGFGLTGIAERVRLAGGELQVQTHDGVFEVTAVMPCRN